MKKILQFFALIVLIPTLTFAATAVPWTAVDTTSGFISPGKINGTIQGIIVSASSTVGAGGASRGLTILGGATTTGNSLVVGIASVGTTSVSTDQLRIQGSGGNIVNFLSTTGTSLGSMSSGGTFGAVNFDTGGNFKGHNSSSCLGMDQGTGKANFTNCSTTGVQLNYATANTLAIANADGSDGGRFGVGTTTPGAILSISNSNGTAAKTPLFLIASTTAGTATTTLLVMDNQGNMGIGTSTLSGGIGLSIQGGLSAPIYIGKDIGSANFNVVAMNGNTTEAYAGFASSGGASSDLFIQTQNRLFFRSAGTPGPTIMSYGPNGVGINLPSSTQTGTGISFAVATGNSGFGTTTPTGKVAIQLNSGETYPANNAFLIASSTVSATTTLFAVTNTGHLYASSTAPTLSSCGTSPGINGDDHHGFITAGATAGGCTMTFAKAYPARPMCFVQNETGSITNTLSYTVSASAMTVTEAALGGDILDYYCEGFGN